MMDPIPLTSLPPTISRGASAATNTPIFATISFVFGDKALNLSTSPWNQLTTSLMAGISASPMEMANS